MLCTARLNASVVIGMLVLFAVSCASLSKHCLQTRVYLVDDQFWSSLTPAAERPVSDDQLGQELQTFLQYAGVVFVNGSYIRVEQGANKVILHNTSMQMNRIEELMAPMKGGGTFYKERIK